MRPERASALLAVFVSAAFALAATETAIRALGLFAAARDAYAEQRAQLGGSDPEVAAEDAALGTQLHPYLGWIRRPGTRVTHRSRPLPIFPEQRLSAWAESEREANQFGYLSHLGDYREVPAGTLAIGVFGGSVAGNMVNVAGDVLRDSVRQRFPEAPAVEILNFGSGGYKQPQSVLALLEMQALGVPLDVVVNLDGFNELVFGALDARAGSHPFFPSRSHYGVTLEMLRGAPSRRETEVAGLIVHERRLAAERVQRTEACWLRHSAIAIAVSGAIVQRHEMRAQVLEAELQSIAVARPEDAGVASLPVTCPEKDEACLGLIADLWERSSRAMAAIADAMGARYVHLLQPNQYVEGSKPLSAEELQHAYRIFHATHSVRAGYPLLRERGRHLTESGIPFRDLTQLFADEADTLYRDECCHLNARGNSILARAVADAVVAALEAPPPWMPDQRR